MKQSADEQFSSALDAANIRIKIYRPEKARSVTLSSGGTLSPEKFGKKLFESLGSKIVEYPEVFKATQDISVLEDMLKSFAEESGILKKQEEIQIPDSYKTLTLNLDQSHSGRDLRFFMTTPNETISHISGNVWMRVCGLPEEDALSMARKVVPEYQPRSKPGIVSRTTMGDEETSIFNSYIPPKWLDVKEKTPDKLPTLFEKLVNHLFPLVEEREYFFAWLHASLFKRSLVYLVLCGNPGVGKNTLKKVVRALHGHQNAVDGKRSTFAERFNSQFDENTLIWFDELHYDMEMENAMKEIQNDTISIERKGVDATRSTKLFASCVISNNKPRDNYIAFDARKFAPLVLTSKRLERSMQWEEIDLLTRKVESWDSEDFDLIFLAQIGRWIKKHANTKKYPHLEYKGPMFYKLAHTSMSRWQKKAAQLVLETKPAANGRVIFNEKKGFLWSSMAEASSRKSVDRSTQFPDFSTVKHFFDVFVDSKGKKAFKTELVEENIMGDFWVRVVNKDARVMTEVEVVKEIEGDANGKKKNAREVEEDFDL